MYYHYTSIDALFNIVLSRRIWFSSLAFMNDEKEGYDLHEVLTEVLELKHGSEHCKQALNLIDQSIDVYLRHQLSFSASTLRDDISQWRAYTELGKGVCIEFDDGFIPDPNIKKINCIYDFDAKKEAIVSDHNLKANDKVLNTLLNDEQGTKEYVKSIIDTLVRFKSPSFKPEQEVRWVYTADSTIYNQDHKFRPHRLGLTIYKEVPVDLRHVKSLTIGPKVPKQNLKTIEDFILQNDCQGFVSQSKVWLR